MTKDGGQASYHGISFAYEPALATSFTAQDCPFIAYQTGMSLADFHVAYTLFTVPSYNKRGTYLQPEIKVVAVNEENLQGYNGYIYPSLQVMGELRNMTGQPQQSPLWFEGAVLRVHSRYLDIQNGAGVRAVIEYAQDLFFFTNNDLLYAFDGLTRDGRYYVGVRFPIEAPFLISIENSNPRTNTNPQAIPIPNWPNDYSEQGKVIEAYNQEALRRFDLTADSDFTPRLTALDALVASLRIEPP